MPHVCREGDFLHAAGRGRATPARRPCSAALPAAICGRAASRTGPTPTATSAIPISSARMARAAASSRPPTLWPRVPRGGAARHGPAFIVLTGGEPMLQVDQDLIDALHARGFAIAIETNGTLAAFRRISTGSASAPRPGSRSCSAAGDELKLVYPAGGLDPTHPRALEFAHRFLQPMDGPERARATPSARSPTARRTRPGACPCRPTSSSAFPDSSAVRRV